MHIAPSVGVGASPCRASGACGGTHCPTPSAAPSPADRPGSPRLPVQCGAGSPLVSLDAATVLEEAGAWCVFLKVRLCERHPSHVTFPCLPRPESSARPRVGPRTQRVQGASVRGACARPRAVQVLCLESGTSSENPPGGVWNGAGSCLPLRPPPRSSAPRGRVLPKVRFPQGRVPPRSGSAPRRSEGNRKALSLSDRCTCPVTRDWWATRKPTD